ncbi:MAG: SatD family protein, partial [Methanomassiliicoccaceae archaeon]|nr:SatD family protein [Methanomassiliicoccaceae archaeon]
FCCYFFIRSAFFPYEMRCGIGAGSLIDMPYRSSNMMDGTSYHNARNILTFSKDNGYDMLFGSGCKEDDFVNRYLAAAQALMSKQSRKQRIVDNLISLTDPLITDDVDTKEYNKGIRRFIESCAEIYRDSDRTTGDYSFTAAAPSVNLSELAYRSNIFFNMKTVGRNNQTMIGRMLNVSSENIRQMMIKGDVEMIRSLLIGASLSAEQCLCEG